MISASAAIAALLLASSGPAPATSDATLDALVAEAERSAKQLNGGDTPLYYLSYRLGGGTGYEITASYGAVEARVDVAPEDGRSRALDVSARVGSPRLDSTHRIRGGRFEWDPGDSAWGGFLRVPVETDPGALRLAVWKATDAAYKAAVKKLIRVRTNKAIKVEEEDDAGDFTQDPPHVAALDSPPIAVDKGAWAERLRKLSALFKKYPRILHSQLSLMGSQSTHYFVDTDGARIRETRSRARLMVTASEKADDGMELELYKDYEAVTPDQLPGDAELAALVDDLAARLEALRTAPVIDPYAGPAIIANRAASVFFHEIFGHRMEGHRQKDADEGHTFTHKVGEPVLPKFLSVVDDPTRERFGKVWLNGHYAFDDQGVPAQAAVLVDQGILRGFLMDRSPLHGFAHSNGHGRAAPGRAPVARQGNLIVTSSESVSFPELRRRLIEEVKRRGKPYGLIFDEISGGFTLTRADIGLPQAFKVLPLTVKRVFPDGRPDELVRGVDLIGTPLQSFETILATGDDPDVFNGYCGAESGFLPVAAVSPSLLVGNIEVDRRAPDHDRPPLLPPPLHPESPWYAPGEAATAAAGGR